MILIGFIVLAIFVGAGWLIRRVRPDRMFNGPAVFIPVWLVWCVYDSWLGVQAGYPVMTEAALHAVIFLVPAALAWFLVRRPQF